VRRGALELLGGRAHLHAQDDALHGLAPLELGREEGGQQEAREGARDGLEGARPRAMRASSWGGGGCAPPPAPPCVRVCAPHLLRADDVPHAERADARDGQQQLGHGRAHLQRRGRASLEAGRGGAQRGARTFSERSWMRGARAGSSGATTAWQRGCMQAMGWVGVGGG